MTQTQLARRIGMKQSTVSRMESGERRVSLLELADVADALKVDPVELFRACLPERR
jgi:transcriptional regulator with XRE-family HTH domain